MKKCTSCTKDLPDAALHCVFCGAKQASAPMPAPSAAKTVMGYQANDLIEQLRSQATAPKPPAGHPLAAPQPAPVAPAPVAPAPIAPAPAPAPAPSFGGPPKSPSGGLAPASHAQAPTMFASGPPPGAVAASAGVSPMAATLAAPPSAPLSPPAPSFGGGGMAPPVSANAATLAAPPAGGGFPAMTPPPAANPYGMPAPTPAPSFGNAPMAGGYTLPNNSQVQPQGQPGRPIEPWKDGLRLMMFIFGGLLLISFLLPWSTDPMAFSWDAIIHGEGTAKIMPLLVGGTGLLALVFAAMPLGTAARGGIMGALGLAGIFAPLLLFFGVSNWQGIITHAGLLCVIAGLLLRSEYHDSIMPRILATVGAIAVLAPDVIPQHGEIPILSYFKIFGGGHGLGLEILILGIMSLAWLALVVCAFFVWLPAPNGGFPKVVMWLLVAWPALEAVLSMLLQGHLGRLADSPVQILSWASGMGGEHGYGGLPVAFMVLFAYGTASLLGKSLE